MLINELDDVRLAKLPRRRCVGGGNQSGVFGLPLGFVHCVANEAARDGADGPAHDRTKSVCPVALPISAPVPAPMPPPASTPLSVLFMEAQPLTISTRSRAIP